MREGVLPVPCLRIRPHPDTVIRQINTKLLRPYLLTYLLTPWCRILLEKLTGLQLVKKFPAFLWNPKVHYRPHKRPPPVLILGQPNPIHIPTSHLLKIHPNIIHPSTPRSPQWSLSLRFPHQDPIRPPLLTHTRHMPRPSLPSITNWNYSHCFNSTCKTMAQKYVRIYLCSSLRQKYYGFF